MNERNYTPLNAEELEALRRIDACTLANAIETFHERLRCEGFVDNSIHALFPHLPTIVGFAATLKIRGASPPTADGIYPDRTDWWDYVLSLPVPRFVVIEDISARPGFGSLLGAVHVNILRTLGCVGALTNGSVRDLPALEKLNFPVFAGGVSVSHAYIHVVQYGHPVKIGGLTIQSGDLLHGELHGVQTIPLHISRRIPEAAARISARESEIIEACHAPDFPIEQLRRLIGGSKG